MLDIWLLICCILVLLSFPIAMMFCIENMYSLMCNEDR